jgi:hypothetical protein
MLDARYWIPDAGYWILDTGYSMFNTGCLNLDRTSDPTSHIPHLTSHFHNFYSIAR